METLMNIHDIPLRKMNWSDLQALQLLILDELLLWDNHRLATPIKAGEPSEEYIKRLSLELKITMHDARQIFNKYMGLH
jgi:hypothetical protein